MPKQAHQTSRDRILCFGVISMTILGAVFPANAQYKGQQGDIVVIGNSPSEWSKFNNYWKQLLQQNTPNTPAQPEVASAESLSGGAEDPEVLKTKLIKNLAVSGLKLQPILKLNGSSQLIGNLSNGNSESVTVSAVNFEVVDKTGKFVQSGSAKPEPATLAPGQMVTFKADLLGLVADPSYRVKLAPAPFSIQGGV